MVRPSRAAAVKDGRILRPPAGLVLDGHEHGGRLMWVGNDSRAWYRPLVVDQRKMADR